MDDVVDQQAILAAALAEVISAGIDAFSLERVAKRAGVDKSAITRIWGDRRVLLLDAQLSSSAQRVPIPDTGRLRGDLLALVGSLVELSQTAEGRRSMHRFLAASGDADLSDVRIDFWRVRLDEMTSVLRRADERGELRDDVDPAEAIRMFAGASLFDVVFADVPVRQEYITQMLDIFIRGICKAS
ncbi:TetR/AcrR family transcriptional regulator [Mycobacterium sp. NBC_00419]|uniref:TetR/AcrR family transcriptional regulator n=1 Tax=Mycobacterium sp. NBC_00419 TaxID=2975989 RepID=UPI002E1D0E78